MKNILFFLFLIIIFTFGCDTDENSGNNSEGTITIINVTPSSDLDIDTSYAFTVEVSYNLTSDNQGELNIGFNTNSVNTFIMDTNSKIIISSGGSGSHTFSVTATTKDYGVNGDFKAFVNIADYPHESTYMPLDTDTQILTF